MTTQPTVTTSSSHDRIVHAAGRLFAERGYDATSTRAIADAVGLNIATVAYHVGGKAQLYREVMRRAHEAQREAVTAAAADLRACPATVNGTRSALHEFVDAYLQFCLDHPEVPALWMRRWLADGADSGELEREFIGPLVGQVAELVRELVARVRPDATADVDLLVYTIVWTVHSFSRAGLVATDGQRLAPTDAAVLERFRRHLHQLVDGALVPT